MLGKGAVQCCTELNLSFYQPNEYHISKIMLSFDNRAEQCPYQDDEAGHGGARVDVDERHGARHVPAE